ncbi:Cd(II)/Pb(II)-responsive transcriptional regulator [Caldimonas thermodepolymerans]|jgi:Cd(II)/Pb(II)-responsive transcriptional regulator|uniref:Cd(II)/Pb(II)-responsive transcriptional regulator n=1 Tax=Caldimonas thermodepolymerans TaxID=215580 RepID=A0A2S5T9H0_9BURK|nr:Cd(II)/Pb(II)-responsive transcriptional regulator [Caldimonas thermodepolymerans]PPE71650.1 Cd(II)/Pb(II)-responsive transcriptional regulator [Caldimonas thermodepolymerans]QPC30677.1 Cd(II)/Pb(II)-responsive transcriptional regulator [Caldimonas thermodepolymerans]RDI02714.1 Cd(II)/Pb(II)-responsive transcriptional regulator [Caldimonas thermodepolymerans]TCP08756.1 Cd(II)/Pb(II)-responsive transcriptional regulator [Caldimonas thermodepolymerans]UZG43412.1 Cd(II)/Pb(II)-responsive trans
MKIGDLAAASDTPVETIRYYERAGLLPAPPRTASNYRHYDESHAARLRFIRHCRALDLSLDEIRTLLELRDHPQASCAEANAVIDEHLGHVAQRIRELKLLQAQLRELRSACNGDGPGRDCGILGRLEQETPAPLASGHGTTHLGRTHGR